MALPLGVDFLAVVEMPPSMAMAPAQDGVILPIDPREAFTTRQFSHVPVLIGTNLLEGNFFVASAERSLGRRMTDAADCAPRHSCQFMRDRGLVVAKLP